VSQYYFDLTMKSYKMHWKRFKTFIIYLHNDKNYFFNFFKKWVTCFTTFVITFDNVKLLIIIHLYNTKMLSIYFHSYLHILSITNNACLSTWTCYICIFMSTVFIWWSIWIVYVFFNVIIDTTIERETKKSIQYDHETLKQVNMVARESESINKTLGINSIEYLESSYMHIMLFSCLSWKPWASQLISIECNIIMIWNSELDLQGTLVIKTLWNMNL